MMPADREALLDKLKQSDEVTIAVTGRKSKRKRSTPVWFILEGRTMLIVPVKGPRTSWFMNLVKDPQIELSVGRKAVTLEATLAKDAKETERILGKLREKYRSMWSESYYPGHDAYVQAIL